MIKNTFNAAEWVSEICNKFADGDYIYRGVTEIFADKDGINSSIYRKHKTDFEFGDKFLPVHVESEIVKKARRLFKPDTSNIEILTDMRHFGGNTTLIDFTRDLMVALFFACNGDFDDPGNLIAFSTKGVSTPEDIDYKAQVWKDSIIEPVQTERSQARTTAQSSVFVHAPRGYLDRAKCEVVEIEKDWKKPILEHLRKFHNISHDTIYNDLVGFIANEENFRTAELHFYRGLKLQNNQKHEEAISEYGEAIRLNSDSIHTYNNRGSSKASLGLHKEAVSDYKEVVRLNPNHVGAYYNCGNSMVSLGQNKEAIVYYNKAIQLNPNYYEAYCNRGLARARLRQDKEAISDFDKAILLNPGDYISYNNRALSKAEIGLNEEAFADYDQALILNPFDTGIYCNYGTLQAKLGQYKEAFVYFDKAIKINSLDARIYYSRGLTKAHLGQHQEAKNDFDMVLRLNPDVAEAYYNRGIAKRELGQDKEAEADFEKARSLRPTLPNPPK